MTGINDYGIVADLYDTYVPATFDIPFFVNESKKCDGEVLELMAGTGRVSLPLVQAGVKLTCTDMSAELLAILSDKLASKGLHADVHQADVCDFDLGKQFDLVIIPFSSFAHIVSPQEQLNALTCIRKHLVPGGEFIVTLGNPAQRRATVDGKLRLFRKYELAEGRGTLLLWLLESFDPADDHIVNTLEFFEEYDAKGILQAKRLMELKFRLSSKDEFEALATSAGLKVMALYGDYDYSEFRENSSSVMIWRLQNTMD